MPDPNQQGPMSWANLLNQFGGGAGGSQDPVPAVIAGAANSICCEPVFAQMSKKAFVVLAVVILIVAAFFVTGGSIHRSTSIASISGCSLLSLCCSPSFFGVLHLPPNL